MSRMPLVSIMIPNYNHSRYLPDCIQSVLNQTYPNIEAVVLDNQSEDNSVSIAAQFAGGKIRVCRNAFNIVNGSYKVLAETLTTGKYMMLLCADDYIEPEFVERAVSIMEEHPNVGYVHGERDFVAPDGKIIELDPFYTCSFIAPGEHDTPVYMVTTVAHPSQGIFRRSSFYEVRGYDKVIDHANADRLLWFYLSQVSDYAYIRDKMCRIRIGEQTETFITQENFQHAILMYLTVKEFVSYGKKHHLEDVTQREGEAFHRTAVDLMDCAGGMIMKGDWEKADVYLKFCYVVSRKIAEHSHFKQLQRMINEKKADFQLLKQMKKGSYTKRRSYSPPLGFVRL